MGVTTNVRYVRVKVRYPSPTAHFASLRLRTADSRALGARASTVPAQFTFYMITVYANNYNKSQRDKITEDTTPMSDRYETQPKIASGLQQSAHKASLTRPPSAQLLPEPQVEKLCSACLDLILRKVRAWFGMAAPLGACRHISTPSNRP